MRMPYLGQHSGRGVGSTPVLIPEPPQELNNMMWGLLGPTAIPTPPTPSTLAPSTLGISTSSVSSIAPGENENAARFANLGSRPTPQGGSPWSNASPVEKAAFLEAMRRLPWTERFTIWPDFQTTTNLSNLSFALMGGALAIVFTLIVTGKK